MLAKVWKKVLLAICIIACIYNVMNKLVNRTSLEIQLRSVQDQSSLIDITDDKKTEVIEATDDSSTINTDTKIEENQTNNTIVVIY